MCAFSREELRKGRREAQTKIEEKKQDHNHIHLGGSSYINASEREAIFYSVPLYWQLAGSKAKKVKGQLADKLRYALQASEAEA